MPNGRLGTKVHYYMDSNTPGHGQRKTKPYVLAHEFGHHLGLLHTHTSVSYVSADPHTDVINLMKANNWTTMSDLDSDLNYTWTPTQPVQVFDTPPDVDDEYYELKGWNPANRWQGVQLYCPANSIDFTFYPDRYNVMNYWPICDDYRRLSKDQGRMVREFLMQPIHIELLSLTPGHYEPYGIGCGTATGGARLFAAGCPRIDNTVNLTFERVPTGRPAFLILGVRKTTTDLTPMGATGCRLYSSLDVVLPFQTSRLLPGFYPLPLPKNYSLVGNHIYTQIAVQDPSANGLGLITPTASTCSWATDNSASAKELGPPSRGWVSRALLPTDEPTAMNTQSLRIILIVLVSSIALAAQVKYSNPLTDLAALDVHEPFENGTAVLVHDDRGRALAFADVLVIDLKRLAGRKVTSLDFRFRHPFNFEKGNLASWLDGATRYRTDEAGRVSVDGGRGRRIVAVHDHRVGRLRKLAEGRKEITVVVPHADSVPVRVVDHRGRPAVSVPLTVVAGTDYQVTRMMDLTRGDGFARVRLQKHLLTGKQPLSVLIPIPSREPITATLDRQLIGADSSRAITVKLPPCGSVRVYLRDETDGPRTGIIGGNAGIAGFSRHRMKCPPVTIRDDSATWLYVELGIDVAIQINAPAAGSPYSTIAHGPSSPGEMVVAPIGGKPGPDSISVIPLDHTGESLAGAKVHVILATPGSSSHRPETVPIDDPLVVKIPAEYRTHGTITILHRPEDGYGDAIRFEIPPLSGEALGEVKLEPEPVFLAGRVVTPEGKPVSGVILSASPCYSARILGNGSSGGSGASIGHRVVSDSQGRFEMRELGVNVNLVPVTLESKDWCLMDHKTPRSLVLSHGTVDNRIVVTKGGKLTGSLRAIPEGIEFHGTIRVIASERLDKRPSYGMGTMCAVDGNRFKAENLPPGEYALLVSHQGTQKPAFVIDSLSVKGGETCADERLQALDWTQVWRPISIRVVDGAGTLQPKAALTIVHSTDHGHSSGSVERNRNGIVRCLFPNSDAILKVEQRGMRTLLIEEVKDAMQIVMRPRIQVAIEVRGLPKLPQRSRVSVCLTPPGSAMWRRILGPRATLRAALKAGKVSFGISHAGKCSVQLQVFSGGRMHKMDTGVIEVHDQLQHDAVIELDAEDRRAILRALAG